jgi:hypothetical protein
MGENGPNTKIRQHIDRFFAWHGREEHDWPIGPAHVELPRLRVLEFAPGPMTDLWVYATFGLEPELDCVLFMKDTKQVWGTSWLYRE